MPCKTERLEVRREWVQGAHTIKHSYEKWTDCQGQKKIITGTCVFSHVTKKKKHDVLERETE